MASPFADPDRPQVPVRALGLSLLALAVPVLGAVLAPTWMAEEASVLLWLSALIPPFLLTYHRGWRGATLALAAGMAALALGNLLAVALSLPIPEFRILFWVISTYIALCFGMGLMAELLRRERAAAEAMALTDPLTLMPNRRHAAIFLDQAFALAVRGDPVTLVLTDLDRFKEVNDRYGHRAGDEVLQGFTDALRTVTRRMDLSARWGGEEFLSILHNCRAEGAEIFLGRLRKEYETRRFPWGRVTFSAGIAQYAPGMRSAEDLLEAADRALYEAKEAGRDTHRIAPPPPVVTEFSQALATAAFHGAASSGMAERGAEGDGRSWPEGPERAGSRAILVEAPEDRVPGALFQGDEPDNALFGAEAGPLPRGSEQLLVVDDDRASRKALGLVLRRLGYDVVEAPDAEAALATAASMERRVDLLVTDLVMPGLSGFSLMKRLQELQGPSRVLYISGRVREAVEWAAAPGAVQRYLTKPVGAVEVARVVRDALDAPLPQPVSSRPVSDDEPASPSASLRQVAPREEAR